MEEQTVLVMQFRALTATLSLVQVYPVTGLKKYKAIFECFEQQPLIHGVSGAPVLSLVTMESDNATGPAPCQASARAWVRIMTQSIVSSPHALAL